MDDIPDAVEVGQRMRAMQGSDNYEDLVCDVEEYLRVYKEEIDRLRGLVPS